MMLQLHHEAGRRIDILTGDGALLWRYVYIPDTPPNEAPRPYAHPVCSRRGEVLTNFRPNDHPWHHGLSLTLASVSGVNFWGGPSYASDGGYQWRNDHGTQRHRSWETLRPDLLDERLEWCRADGSVLMEERRTLRTILGPNSWSLGWTSELRNVTNGELVLGNWHALGGLAGSHYTGLQFRGARDLLDEHGDPAIGISAEGGRAGEAEVHGALAQWMEWSCQHDGTLRRTRIRFENTGGAIPWFVRAKNPLAAFAFHRERTVSLSPDATLRLDHRLTFTTP